MTTRVRPMRQGDLDEIVRLSIAAWEPVFASFRQVLGPAIYPLLYPDWVRSQTETAESFCNDPKNTVAVAERDGRVVGFVVYELNKEKKLGTIQLLAVHPAGQASEMDQQAGRQAGGQVLLALPVCLPGGNSQQFQHGRQCAVEAGRAGMADLRSAVETPRSLRHGRLCSVSGGRVSASSRGGERCRQRRRCRPASARRSRARGPARRRWQSCRHPHPPPRRW